jgi:hypothetical protein
MHAYANLAPTESKIHNPWTTASYSILGAAALCWLAFSYGYIEDDAFIHLEFARSLAEGRGFSFDGHVVNGDTAPLWVMLLVAVHSVGFGWIAAAKFLCGLGIVTALSGVWRITSEIAANAQYERTLPFAAVFLTAINPYFVHWSFSGMESVTALGVSLWAVWAVFAASPQSFRRLTIGALLLSIAPLLRPELLLLSASAGAVLLYHAWRLPPPPARPFAAVALFAIVMALPTILGSAYALQTFASIMPNTNAAKRGGALISVAMNLASVYFVGFAGTLLLFPFVARRLGKPGVPVAVWMLMLWPAACVVFYLADHTVCCPCRA